MFKFSRHLCQSPQVPVHAVVAEVSQKSQATLSLSHALSCLHTHTSLTLVLDHAGPKVHKVLHIKASRRLDQASTMQGWEVLTRATCSTWQTRRIHDALQAGTTDLVPSKPQILNALLHILCCFVRFVVRDLASVVRQRISAVVRASSYKLPGYKTRFPTV